MYCMDIKILKINLDNIIQHTLSVKMSVKKSLL